MRTFALIFSFFILHFSFSQEHEKKVAEMLAKNELKEVIAYMDANDLSTKDGFRFDYWESKARLDNRKDISDLQEKALKNAPDNSETTMLKYSFLYHKFHNMDASADEEMIKTGMDLEKKIEAYGKKDPFYARLNILFAEYLMELGYYLEASKRAKLALKADSKLRNANLLYGYAMILAEGGDKSVKYIEKEVKLHPNNPDAFWVMGDLTEYSKGICDETCLGYKAMASEASPQEMEYFVYYLTALGDAGMYDLVVENIESVGSKYDEKTMAYMKAEAYLFMDQYQDSKALCEKHLKKFPKDDRMLYLLSQNLIYLDQIDEGLKVALEMNSLAPDDPMYKFALAEIYYYQEEDELALQICEKEIKDSSDYAMFYLLASDIYFESDDIDKGVELFQEAGQRTGFWSDVLDFQIVTYLDAVVDEMPKEIFNKTLKAIEEAYEDENKQCILDYYHYKKNDPDNLSKITVKCKEYIENGAMN